MDDHTFDDQKIAFDWINTIESKSAQIRESDIYPRLKSWVNSVSPIEILDIGAGQGVCSNEIPLVSRQYTGIEPSIYLLERAKRLYQHENRKFLLGNAYDLPLSECTFDAAFSISVWHLPEELPKAAHEMSRVLKENGHFLIISANPGAYPIWTSLYLESKIDCRRFEGKVKHQDQSFSHDILYLHTLDEIKHSLESANLKIESIETFRPTEKHFGLESYISIQGQKRF